MSSNHDKPLDKVDPTSEACVNCKNWKNATHIKEFVLVRLLEYLEDNKDKILDDQLLDAIHVCVLCSGEEAREIYQNKPDKK